MSNDPQLQINSNIGGNVLGNVIVAGGNISYQSVERPKPETPYLAPPLPPHHVAREAELLELYHLLVESRTDVTITALRGMGGIGKTTLAIALCRDKRILDYFVDGVLWATLGPDSDPTRTLAQWLDAFGVSYVDLPDNETRASRLRSILSRKKCLIVIDDVWDSTTLSVLQVGGSECATLITTRERKIAQKAGRSHELNVLQPEQATAILQQWAGKHSNDNLQGASELAKRLGYLPLAVVLAGAQAQDGRTWDQLLVSLRASQGDLTLLDLDDPIVRDESLALTFKLSVDQLNPKLAERFNMLAVFAAGREAPLNPLAAAAIWQVDEIEASRSLARLARAALLERTHVEVDPDCEYYTLHLLLSDYARANLPASVLKEASERHAKHYFEIALETEKNWRSIDAGLAQLSLILERYLEEMELEELLLFLDVMFNFFRHRAYWNQMSTWVSVAGRRLSKQPDARLEAKFESILGTVEHQRGSLDAAMKHYQRALMLSRDTEWRSEEAAILNNIGHLHRIKSEWEMALEHFELCIRIEEETGNVLGKAAAYSNMAYVYGTCGRPDTSLEFYEKSLACWQLLGKRHGLAATLVDIGSIHRDRGNFGEALNHINQGLTIVREIGARAEEAEILNSLGRVYHEMNSLEEALGYYSESLKLCREQGDRLGIALSLNNIAHIKAEYDHWFDALGLYFESLGIRQEVGDIAGEAQCINNIGGVYLRFGNLTMALKCYHQALTTWHSLNYRVDEATALINISLIYHLSGDLQSAIKLMEWATESLKELKHINYDSAQEHLEELYREALLQQ